MQTLRMCLMGCLLMLAWTPAGATLSERVWEQLSEIHEHISEQRLEAAATALDRLARQVDGDSHEAARMLEARARLHEMRDEPDEALALIEQALAIEEQPQDLRQHLEYMRARLLMAQARYEEALARLEAWFDAVEAPAPRAWMLRAAIYQQLDRPGDAIEAARRAIDMADRPRADWYGFLAGVLMQESAWTEARKVLETMLGHWPLKARYYEQLAAVHMQLDDHAAALTTLRMADAAGVLERESAILRLVQLAMMEEIPAPAGRLLEQALAEGLVETIPEHLEVLADAWLMAREWARAMDALEQLARRSGEGAPWLRMARLAFERQQPERVVRYVGEALAAGVDTPARARMLEGMAHIELAQYEQAAAAFEQAREDEDIASQAGQWLRYIEAIN